jgi:hypothetical protein
VKVIRISKMKEVSDGDKCPKASKGYKDTIELWNANRDQIKWRSAVNELRG